MSDGVLGAAVPFQPREVCRSPVRAWGQPYVVTATFSFAQSVFENVTTPSQGRLSCRPPLGVSHDGTCPVVPASPTGDTFAADDWPGPEIHERRRLPHPAPRCGSRCTRRPLNSSGFRSGRGKASPGLRATVSVVATLSSPGAKPSSQESPFSSPTGGPVNHRPARARRGDREGARGARRGPPGHGDAADLHADRVAPAVTAEGVPHQPYDCSLTPLSAVNLPTAPAAPPALGGNRSMPDPDKEALAVGQALGLRRPLRPPFFVSMRCPPHSC